MTRDKSSWWRIEGAEEEESEIRRTRGRGDSRLESTQKEIVVSGSAGFMSEWLQLAIKCAYSQNFESDVQGQYVNTGWREKWG